jgi:hypothetical protein
MKRAILIAVTIVVASLGAAQVASAASGDNYIPYLGGVGDPLGLTSSARPDAFETGGIGATDATGPRVDVRGFCEGEGKLLAERHYIGFCHLADDL